jgi:hypothetical protein
MSKHICFINLKYLIFKNRGSTRRLLIKYGRLYAVAMCVYFLTRIAWLVATDKLASGCRACHALHPSNSANPVQKKKNSGQLYQNCSDGLGPMIRISFLHQSTIIGFRVAHNCLIKLYMLFLMMQFVCSCHTIQVLFCTENDST